MATTKRLSREQRSQQILSVATEVFAQRGFHNTSMDEIAEAAGISKPVVYQHFQSKEDLFTTVTGTAITKLQEQLIDKLETVKDRRERVFETFKVFFDFVHENRSAFLILTRFKGDTVTTHELWADAQSAYVDLIAHSIIENQGVTETEAQVLGRAIVGMAEQAAVVYFDDPTVSVSKVAELTARLAFQGLSSITGSVMDLHDAEPASPAAEKDTAEADNA